MWGLLKRTGECSRFLEALERNADGAALPPALREHAMACAECRAAVEDATASRALLQGLPSQASEPRPWFASRVMAAIAAREAELRRPVDAWTVVPRLAAKLSWASALALLLASTWLYERPRPMPTKQAFIDLAGDPENLSAAAQDQDELLIGSQEHEQ